MLNPRVSRSRISYRASAAGRTPFAPGPSNRFRVSEPGSTQNSAICGGDGDGPVRRTAGAQATAHAVATTTPAIRRVRKATKGVEQVRCQMGCGYRAADRAHTRLTERSRFKRLAFGLHFC